MENPTNVINSYLCGDNTGPLVRCFNKPASLQSHN